MIDKNILSQLTPSRMPIRRMPGESDDSAENSVGEDVYQGVDPFEEVPK